MLSSWALAYAERWGLPKPAYDELADVLAAIKRGEIVGGDVDTAMPDIVEDEVEDVPLPVIIEGAAERYEDINQIGLGGMGEVRRVWDMTMNRSLAMKILRKDLLDRPDLFARFREEAEATAQLEHPGVVPIHDLGKLPDGRLFFTMKEVRGRTLLDVIDEIHGASSGSWETGPTGWTLFKTVQVFVAVCEAIAYAHSRAVLHRDLKPSNVMVGAFGEVVVMDWGLAKIGNDPTSFGDSVSIDSGTAPIMTERSRASAYMTLSGSIAGTPNYMPPEQARGDHGRVGPWSDVYALGAILYHILSDRPPYDGMITEQVVEKVLSGPPPPAGPRWRKSRGSNPAIEDELIGICERAMAPEIADRYMDAATMAEAVHGWLEGARTREHALALVRRAEELEPVMDDLRKSAITLRGKAAYLLEQLPTDAATEDKRSGWELQDEAQTVTEALEIETERYTNLLRAALTHSPDLEAANERLQALKPGHTASGRGYVSLNTEPAGARVLLHRSRAVGRRIVETNPIDLGVTPLDRVAVGTGSWLVTVSDGSQTLRYPIIVERGQHWTSAAPGHSEPHPLPLRAEVAEDEVVVPASWFRCGGDFETEDSLPSQRVWVDDFAMKICPVTSEEYQAFLNDTGSAEKHIPLATRTPAHDRQPVVGVTIAAAEAYAVWLSEKDGLPWRLPTEAEWEKAARGTDLRQRPWGDHVDQNWCCYLDSHADVPRIASVDDYPEDVSVYGVRGMGGNVRDWCKDPDAPAESAMARGGHWLGVAQLTRSALRFRIPFGADETVGFRLVRTL